MIDCLHAMAPDNDQLLCYVLEGEAMPLWAKEHLQQCKKCQMRLTGCQQTNSFLLARLYRSQCPDATKLSHYCVGLMSADDDIYITRHLKICPLCAQEATEVRHVLVDFEPFPAPSSFS